MGQKQNTSMKKMMLSLSPNKVVLGSVLYNFGRFRLFLPARQPHSNSYLTDIQIQQEQEIVNKPLQLDFKFYIEFTMQKAGRFPK